MGITRAHRTTAGQGWLRRSRSKLIAIAAIVGILASGAIGSGSAPAYAADWPSWNDVNNARANEAAAKAKIVEIQALIAGLVAEAERTQADADAKGAVYREADQAFQEAAFKATQLQSQADAAQTVADESKKRAGQMAAQLARAGGNDFTTNLLLNSGKADSLLYGLGLAGKITEQADAIYTRALQDQNTAQSLTDQANVARTILEKLKVVAEAAFAEAQAASVAAATALAAQQEHQVVLEAQLAVLTENRAATEADYLKGVQERIGSGASLDAGEISLSGWARPTGGRITDPFGMRWHPVDGGYRLHGGTDIGAACGQNIFAASSGTVVYAGRNGTYGNWVLINHGGGIQTGYAHIVDGGILVSVGQEVMVGQNIAKVGTTGASTGCHLHFEVRVNGTQVDSVPFMANQGITIG